MRSSRWLVIVVLALAASAAAGSNHERLTRAELDAASKAAVAALPKVDPAKASHCKTLPTTRPVEQLALASCFHDAGALGAAISIWEHVAYVRDPATRETAILALGPAFEAAGYYDQAAEYYDEAAGLDSIMTSRHPLDPATARAKRIRALCLYRQLGNDDRARSDEYLLARTAGHGPRFDAAATCAALHPIHVPPAH